MTRWLWIALHPLSSGMKLLGIVIPCRWTGSIPFDFGYTGVGYLGGKTMNDIMNAEADATRVVLADNKRPNVTITIDKVDEYNLGQLLYMLEIQTAIIGELYNINTFNHPALAQAKNYTYAL